jgi:hypothetical protein
LIFIDRSLSRRVAEALDVVRRDVLWLEPTFPPDTPDPVWIAEAGANDWLVISRDKKLRTRYENWAAIRDSNVGCFVLTQPEPLRRWPLLQFMARHLDHLIATFETTPRPFIFAVRADGVVRRADEFDGVRRLRSQS